MVKQSAKTPKQPSTIDEYKKALNTSKRDITMLRRHLNNAGREIASMEELVAKQSSRIKALEDQSWLSRLFNLKG